MHTQVMEMDFDADPNAGEGVALEREQETESAAELEVEGTEQEQPIAEGQEETGEGQEENAESQAEGQKIRAKEFAEQAGWTLEEFYRDVVVPGKDGDITLSQALDNYKALEGENEVLRQERQQLQERATASAVPQQVSPEAQELFYRAKVLQEQYTSTKWHEMDPAQATNLRMDLQDAIRQTTEAAYAKQAEHEQGFNHAMAKYAATVDLETARLIPEWRSQRVKGEQEAAIETMLMSEYGFTKQAVDAARMDPKAVKALYDLWSAKRKEADVKKGVRKVNKVAKHLSASAQRQAVKAKATDIGKRFKAERNRDKRMDILLNSDFEVS